MRSTLRMGTTMELILDSCAEHAKELASSFMTIARGLLCAALVSALASGCTAGAAAPGMRETALRAHPEDPSLLELARAPGKEDERALLVIYPRSACSGSASGVLVDDRGHFLGAIAPGTASLLSISSRLRHVHVFSSAEVAAPVGAWFASDLVRLPEAPSGLVLRSSRHSTRECGNGQYFDVVSASKAELEHELEEAPVRWFVIGEGEGQAWLDAHRARVDEVLGRHGRRVVVR